MSRGKSLDEYLGQLRYNSSYFKNKNGTYRVRIGYGKSQTATIGTFDTKEEAIHWHTHFHKIKFLNTIDVFLDEIQKFREDKDLKLLSRIEGRYKRLKYNKDYLVTEYGAVWSFNNGHLKKLKSSLSTDKYLQYSIRSSDRKSSKTFTAHYLVASNFLDEYTDELLIDHIDRNKNNNHFSNLRMVTNRENFLNSDHNDNSKGYSYCKLRKKYKASVKCHNISLYLGAFEDKNSAVNAYKKAKLDSRNFNKKEWTQYIKDYKKFTGD